MNSGRPAMITDQTMCEGQGWDKYVEIGMASHTARAAHLSGWIHHSDERSETGATGAGDGRAVVMGSRETTAMPYPPGLGLSMIGISRIPAESGPIRERRPCE